MKAGVAVADLMCGMYACVAILAALRHRDATGQGQYIDLALYDTQLAWLANAALAYFVTGTPPARHGNAHAQIVPYDVFATADGHLQLSFGNDVQFARLVEVLGAPEWATDARYATNPARVASRVELTHALSARFATRPSEAWLSLLRAAGVPCGPVRTLDQAFADPQAAARGMRIRMPSPHVREGAVELLGNPIQLSASPVSYRRPPPALGAHTRQVLEALLGPDDPQLMAAERAGVL
jgi:crotonobetainyl-CoA:carnitine CoA-transferase CaiB-like acyl-CoA transferase